MLYEIIDGMGNLIEYIEAEDEADARIQFQNWMLENADEDAGPTDYYIEPADDDAESDGWQTDHALPVQRDT
jgi:hypothetical protein